MGAERTAIGTFPTDSVALAGTAASMAVLPADACLLGPINFHVDWTLAFLAGFLDFLWVFSERLILVMIGHLNVLRIVIYIHLTDSSFSRSQFNFAPTNGQNSEAKR